jgi:proteasome lid subunit RPN8/RPN11
MKNMNQMIPLTVANTLDQSVKQRIEARGQQTVKQAVQEAKMAPQGQFDVFDGLGKVVSNQPVDQFRDKTIYIGVQKVAGGALQFDDDWEDDGIDLDDIDQPIRKSVTFIDIGGNRQEIEPQGDETLIEAAERIGLRPRDGTAIEVRDTDNDVVSNRRARDMVGRAFRVNPRAIAGGGFGRGRGQIETHVPVVPIEIVEQTTAFTAPRGRLEMGGLLIGHVDEQGRNVVVAGFFPEQTEASPGYCEFEGGFAAMAAAACDMANERCGGPHTPNLRVIGWIHTHPDIGIFLSGIDVRTFKNLRDMSQDGRCVAVVVDPLRKEHGVFRSPRSAENKDAEKADGKVSLSEDLQARYHKFLDRMRFMQMKNGKQRLPFILTGILRRDRIAQGDVDDIEDARAEALDKAQRSIETLSNKTHRDLNEIRLNTQREIKNQDKSIRSIIESKIKEIKAVHSRLEERLERENKNLRENLSKDRQAINNNSKNINTITEKYQNMSKLLSEQNKITGSSINELENTLSVMKEASEKSDVEVKQAIEVLKSRTDSIKKHSASVDNRLDNIEKQLLEIRESVRPVLVPANNEVKNGASEEVVEEVIEENDISDKPKQNRKAQRKVTNDKADKKKPAVASS